MEDLCSFFDTSFGDLERFALALVGASGAWAVEDLIAGATSLLNKRLPRQSCAPVTIRENLYREIIRLNRRRALAMRMLAETAAPMRRSSDLARLIDRLPIDEKEALLLVVLARFSYAEAARVLEVGEATVQGRLSRARARLDRDQSASLGRSPAPHLRVVK